MFHYHQKRENVWYCMFHALTTSLYTVYTGTGKVYDHDYKHSIVLCGRPTPK